LAGLDVLAILDTQAGIGREFDVPDLGLLAANGRNEVVALALDEDFAVHAGQNRLVTLACDDDIFLHAVAVGGDQLVLGRDAHFAALQVGAADAQDTDFAF